MNPSYAVIRKSNTPTPDPDGSQRCPMDGRNAGPCRALRRRNRRPDACPGHHPLCRGASLFVISGGNAMLTNASPVVARCTCLLARVNSSGRTIRLDALRKSITPMCSNLRTSLSLYCDDMALADFLRYQLPPFSPHSLSIDVAISRGFSSLYSV